MFDLSLARPRPPTYVLANLYTVQDVWREWKEGIGGGPAVEQLEERWRHQWRQTPAQRTAWCRRKRIVDEVLYQIKAGLDPDEAVAQLEAQRGEGTIRQLSDQLRNKLTSRLKGGQKGKTRQKGNTQQKGKAKRR